MVYTNIAPAAFSRVSVVSTLQWAVNKKSSINGIGGIVSEEGVASKNQIKKRVEGFTNQVVLESSIQGAEIKRRRK